MNTKKMNINELEQVSGGKDYGTILLKPCAPIIRPTGPIYANIPLPQPIEIPGPEAFNEGQNSVPAPAPLFSGDIVRFTMC